MSLTYQVQVQLDQLAEDLHINPAQQNAWDTYALRVIKLADDIARERFAARQPQAAGSTAPQQFDRLTDAVQNRATAVEEIVEAGRALYATLRPEQLLLADQRLATLTLALESGTAMSAIARRAEGSASGAPPRSP